MELRKPQNDQERSQLLKLYTEAFPDSERKPFEMIRTHEKNGMASIHGIFDPDFAGLLITLQANKDLYLIDYLATEPSRRSTGVGSQALAMFEKAHPHIPVIIEIEDPSVDNDPDKLRRQDFYFRNGFSQMPYTIGLFGVQMRILVRNGTVTFDQYKDLQMQVLGTRADKYVQLIEK